MSRFHLVLEQVPAASEKAAGTCDSNEIILW
jgi:hypothetical protein